MKSISLLAFALFISATTFAQDPAQQKPILLDGKRIDYDAFRNAIKEYDQLPSLKGKPLIVVSSATWCGPCRRAHPFMESIALNGKKANVVYSWLSSSDEETAKKTHKETPVIDVRDETDSVANAFGVKGIPAVRVFDEKGNLIAEGNPLDPDIQKILKEVSGFQEPKQEENHGEGSISQE